MAEIGETTEFRFNVGVNPGYHHGNQQADPQKIVADLWQKHAEFIFKDAGIYVGATVAPAKTVYREEWGCPKGGEDTVVVCGLRNTEFTPNDDLWKINVARVALLVAQELKQSTAYLTFGQVEFLYLKTESK